MMVALATRAALSMRPYTEGHNAFRVRSVLLLTLPSCSIMARDWGGYRVVRHQDVTA